MAEPAKRSVTWERVWEKASGRDRSERWASVHCPGRCRGKEPVVFDA